MGKEAIIRRVEQEWYQQLVEDIKELEYTGIVITKHAIGKRILQDELKFGKPEYGTKKIEGLAKDLDIPKRELWRCVQFARKCPTGTQFEGQSWRHIKNNILPEPREEKEPIPLPKGKYSVIYADPPWEYNDTKGNDPDYAGITYTTMKPEEISKMPIGDISAENSILFIWVTMPMLDVCFDVINGWGFEYKTCGFVWVKTKKECLEADSRGIGHYTKSNAELCLIATKGQFKRNRKDIEQIIYAPRKKHSEKPDEARKRILELCGYVPRIELFARKKVKGWDAYGDDPRIQT